MAITLSTGVSVFVAKTYATKLDFSAASNSAVGGNCALTVVGSTIVAGDFVEVTSGWGRLNQRVVRAGAGTSATSLVLEGVDTSDTTKYPALTGVGSVRKVLTWSEITQLKTISTSGGEQQYADITAINDVVARQMPTTRGAVSVSLEVFDDPTLPYFADVIAADDSRTPYGLRMRFANGSVTVANAYWSLTRVPNIATNEAMTTNISVSFAAEPLRYAA